MVSDDQIRDMLSAIIQEVDYDIWWDTIDDIVEIDRLVEIVKAHLEWPNTTVRCFAMSKASKITGSRGVWLMTRPTGCQGVFYYGGRKEILISRCTIEDLEVWGDGGDPNMSIVEITPEEALAEMDLGWPEAKEHMHQVFARHPIDKV